MTKGSVSWAGSCGRFPFYFKVVNGAHFLKNSPRRKTLPGVMFTDLVAASGMGSVGAESSSSNSGTPAASVETTVLSSWRINCGACRPRIRLEVPRS